MLEGQVWMKLMTWKENAWNTLKQKLEGVGLRALIMCILHIP